MDASSPTTAAAKDEQLPTLAQLSLHDAQESPRSGGDTAVDAVADVPTEPLALPDELEWSDVDLRDAAQARELHAFLLDHYVEDDDGEFRFAYSIEMLQWALLVPGYFAAWHIGVRRRATRELVAFISGTPVRTRAYATTRKTIERNFLCVHKSLRRQRLTPQLIAESMRRANLQDVWHAVYTAGAELPNVLSRARYCHRMLHPEKLVDVGFASKPAWLPMETFVAQHALPDAPATPGLRPMEPKDVAQVTTLLHAYLATLDVVLVLDEAEVAHWMLPRDGVVSSFVVENAATQRVTDVCSFYLLATSVLGHAKHSSLEIAYAFYNVATSVPLVELMRDALVLAERSGCDVFNALDLMDNAQFTAPLQFARGSGVLQFYLDEWPCPPADSDRVGVVLC